MKISIITVCYNSEKTIEDTIKSVLNQSYDNYEYILIDGNSKDRTLDIIKDYSEKFQGKLIWTSEKDKGLYDAMNKGVKMSTGEIVAFINSDDLFCDKDAFLKITNVFKKHENLESVYADLYYVDQKNTERIIRKWITGEQKKFSTGWHPAHPTLYIKKNIYNKYGLFNLNYKLAADFEIMLRFLDGKNVSTYYLKETLVKMRLGGETNKSFKNIIKQNLECIKAFSNNKIKVNKILYPIYRLLPKLKQY
jgi:glycosyltransferase involved in cell wall biosynthesis